MDELTQLPEVINMSSADDIECVVIALLLTDNCNITHLVHQLEARHFSNSYCYRGFDIIRNYTTKFGSMPSLKVFFSECIIQKISEDFIRKINSNFELINSEKPEYYIDKVAEYMHQRVWEVAAVDVAEKVNAGRHGDIDRIVRKAFTAIENVSDGVAYYDDIDARYKLIEETYSTGYPQLDKCLGGGWIPKHVYAIAAPTNYGKSLVLHNWTLVQSLLIRDTIIYSMELSELDMLKRFDSWTLNSKFDISKVDELGTKLKNIKEHIGNRNNLMIKEFPPVSVNVNHLKHYAETQKIKHGFNPKVVVVDYLDLLVPIDNKYDNEYEAQGRVVQELRAWAVESNIIILTATQMNRGAETSQDQGGGGENVSGATIADSYKKLMNLDMVAAIVFNKNDMVQEHPRMRFKIIKNRFGMRNVYIPYSLDFAAMKMVEESWQVQGVQDDTQKLGKKRTKQHCS
jgi:replicative DNA helicase